MRVKRLVLCMMLSLALVVTFIPVISFGGETVDKPIAEEHAVEEPAAETSVEPVFEAKDATVSAKAEVEFSFTPASEVKECSYSLRFEQGDRITVDNNTYTYDEDNSEWVGDSELSYDLDIDTYADPYYLNDGAILKYYVELLEYDSEYDADVVVATAEGFNARVHDIYKRVWINGVRYELIDDENPSQGAGVYDTMDTVTGHVDVLSSVTLSDGVNYPVRGVYFNSDSKVSSVGIPASVNDMYGVGLSDWATDSDDNIVSWTVKPGFVIFGTNGTYAQQYANKYGIAFRDLAAEAAAAAAAAEATRQGTYSGSMPAVKASKPKAAKKSITVKWKKLKKKQLKSGVSKIEVWVSTNTAFARGATIEKTVGKKKASIKIKGLKKGVTYYAKVRAIKYVNGQKVVGKWSGVKKVKVKK
ncbi:MAG: hypothetical protein IJH22_00285 [Firmicutes bacterium]|nr:hypothetical protein [Bacillota bacterium]